jgi:hypothetical protein
MGVFNMKNHLALGIVTVLTVFLQSCAPSTAVRVLSLSYEGQPEAQPLNNPEKLANRFNGPKRVDDEETYIFPGDILTFTVQLQDPNYEFISLLAIRFNGQTIRANSDDSVVSTRDCGANICIDFPFEIQSGVTEYEVEEVKFAKLSSETGVNAIIDSSSNNSINLFYYDEEIFPYVLESIETLNLRINNLVYFNDGDSVEDEFNPHKAGYMERGFYLINYSRNTPAFQKIINHNGIFNLDGMTTAEIEQIPYDNWNYNYDESGDHSFFSQHIFLSYIGQEYDVSVGYYFMYFAFFEAMYKDVFFYNEGNKIYVDILGNQFFFLEMINGMRILPFIEGI